MNRRQKLVQQQFLNNEQAVIKRLKYIYDGALSDINKKIRELEFHIGDLTEEYDWMDDDDPKKEVIRSKIQSKIHQKQYQQALQGQLEGILKEMQTKEFLTVSDYLGTCYEDGFVGSIFDLHGQGVPLLMPIDQESMVRAVQLESKISQGLYTRLGEDVDVLKKRITAEVSRSIATGASFEQCAKRLAGQTKIGYNKAVRIARTEGHRIQCSAADDAAHQAKDRGADIVKKWDATLDGATRESHIAVDGEIRELDEPFSNGLMFPGDPAGGAAEVVNCRCAYLQKARRWLEGSFTKWNNFTDQLETFDSPEAYNEFKKSFFSPENRRYMNYVEQMQDKYGTKDFRKVLDQMTDREYKHYSKLLANNPVYNVKAPVKPVFTPATLDDFPDYFRKNSASKKATQTFVDALNGAEDLDPNIRKLYTHIGDMWNVPADGKISYTVDGHALSRWMDYNGNTTKYTLKIPKMTGDDLSGQLATAFHEIGHFIDMGTYTDKGIMGTKGMASHTFLDLTKAIRSSGSAMSDEIKDLFDDFAKQYRQVQSSLQATYKAKRDQLSADYRAGKITWSDYNKQWKACVKEESAEMDYQCRNLCGGGVGMLSDIYDALSGGSYRDSGTVIYGHGGRHYSSPMHQNAEIFANYMSLSVNNPDLIDMLRKDKPDLCKALDELIEEMAGGIK